MKQINIDSINIIKETFQVSSDDDDDIHAVFFDLSSNFYNITKDELSQIPAEPIDEVILDIGGTFGDFDASRIPWDTENRGILPGNALWGIVSQQATIALFNKISDANQMQDITSLPLNPETNKFTYQSPLFQTTASTQEEAHRLEAAEQIANLAYPILFEAFARGELLDTLKGAVNLPARIIGESVSLTAKIGYTVVDKVTKPIQMLAKLLDKVLLGGATQRAAATGLVIASIATKSVGAQVMRGLAKVGIKTGEAAEKAAAEAAEKASKKGAEKAANKAAQKAAQKAQIDAAKKIGKVALAKVYAKILAKVMGKLVIKMIIGAAITMVSLSAIPFIGKQLDVFYMVVIMPLMMGLQMGGMIDGALTKLGDPEGCCPNNSIPLDQLIPDWAQMIVSNIPVLGDVLSCFFPYMCSVRGTGALVYKKTLTLPNWMNYTWLSCYYIQWPDYNCRVGGRSVMNGKTLSGSVYSWNNEGRGEYTRLSDVVRSPESYAQVNRRMINGQVDDSERQRILPQGQKFFYADFSEPRMLADMGKFYCNWAFKNPYPNDDGTVTVEYISKINYITASSLYSCDAMCEMISVTFNPITGEDYSETTTYDRDRRFYYTCNNSIDPPLFWEDSVGNWRSLIDTYDLAINDLSAFIHQPQFYNTALDAKVLECAYTQMLDASNRYVFISNITMNNLSNQISGLPNNSALISSLPNLVGNDKNVKDFYNGYINASNNIGKIYTSHLENSSSVAARTQIMNKLVAINNASNAIYNYRYNDTTSPSHYSVTSNINTQYKIVGCTHIDYTASSATNPDPLNLESESRYRCNFDVTPYLIRCGGVNMSITKCIDASNVELVIYNYLLQFPTKRIKAINNIKAKGRNICEFTWDEVTVDPVTKIETNLKTNVNTQILYQQDLSSCTFNLPPVVAISGTSNYLFGSQTGGTTSLTTTTSLKNFTNPVSSSDPNYQNYTTLQYEPAKFKFPVFTPPKKMPTSFVESNVDYIPRYDPTNFTRMVDLVRPRKPIRIFYPGNDESNLGNYSNNYCGDPNMLQRFVLSYNGDSNNTNKILKIIRTFTSSSNTCDMEVDTLYKDTNLLKRETMTMNMVEGFQSPVGNNSRPFRYESVNSIGKGLNIDKNTDTLSNPYQDGVSFGDPYLRSFQTEIVPFTSYFNDNLIKDFTNKTKTIRDNTNRILVGLTGTRHLGGPSCSTRCQDGEVVQRIIEQYNKDGVASTNVEAEQNSAKQVLNSATNSSNTCHVLLENKKEIFGNLYSPDRSINNYATENRLVFKKIEMADAGNCTFYPVPNQIYQDISASDLALSSSSNFNTYVTPKRICPESKVNCGNSDLYGPAMRDYIAKTGNTINQSNKYVAIGTNKCDYLINTSIRLKNGTLGLNEDTDGNDINYVLRVSYDTPLYSNSSPQYCAQDPNYVYRYTPDNFVLQTPADLSDVVNNPEYYETIDSNASIASPLLGNIDDIPADFLHNL